MKNRYSRENGGKSQSVRRETPDKTGMGPGHRVPPWGPGLPCDEAMGDKAMESILREAGGSVSGSTPWVVRLLRRIVVLVFGTLMAIRLFFPVKYDVVDGATTHSHTDGITTLLHALGIAVVFGVLMYFLKDD